jgi:hypothetical protein
MTSLTWNKPSPLTVEYVTATGGADVITLMPGVNLGISDDEMSSLRQHPIVTALLESRALEMSRSGPSKTAELSGFDVVEDAKTGEAMPVQQATKGLKPKSTQAVADAIAKEQANNEA